MNLIIIAAIMFSGAVSFFAGKYSIDLNKKAPIQISTAVSIMVGLIAILVSLYVENEFMQIIQSLFDEQNSALP